MITDSQHALVIAWTACPDCGRIKRVDNGCVCQLKFGAKEKRIIRKMSPFWQDYFNVKSI